MPTDDPTTGTPAREGLIAPLLLLTLALLSATGPFSTDLYLASFPEMKVDLDTSATVIQLTLSAFLVGVGIGQVAWGPISDRFGRRRPLLIGSSVTLCASLVAVFAPNVEVLIGARLVQALGAAAALVLARTIIVDLTHGFAAARALSLMMTISAVSPIIAPAVGGALAGHVSWRVVLGVLFVICAAQLIGVVFVIPETLPDERRTHRVAFGNIGQLLRRPAFVGYGMVQTFSFGMLMGYISASSLVYQKVIGTSSLGYGLLFATNSVGIVFASAVSARLARKRIHPSTTVRLAIPLALVSSISVLVIAISPIDAWALAIPIFTAVLSAGFLSGNSSALAMEQGRPHAGAASAALGASMFLAGGIVSALGGLADRGTAVPTGIVMTTCAVLATIGFAFARAYVRRHPTAEAAYAV